MKLKIEIKFTNIETGKTVTSTLMDSNPARIEKSAVKVADVFKRIKSSLQ